MCLEYLAKHDACKSFSYLDQLLNWFWVDKWMQNCIATEYEVDQVWKTIARHS